MKTRITVTGSINGIGVELDGNKLTNLIDDIVMPDRLIRLVREDYRKRYPGKRFKVEWQQCMLDEWHIRVMEVNT
jgi:hypothetical protein